MSLQRCQNETTSNEFLEWAEYLRQDFNVERREDFFLANIAKEIRMSNVKHPEKVKLSTYLLKFKEVKVKTEKSKKKNTLGAWLRWAGIKKV